MVVEADAETVALGADVIIKNYVLESWGARGRYS